MIAALTAPHNAPFVAALALMLLIAAVEAAGLGGLHVDLDDGGVLGWLGVGRVPLLVLLVLALTLFGLAGLALQSVAAASGGPWPLWAAVPAALAAALPATRLAARALAPVLPRDETTAIDLDDLSARRATVLTGTAAPGSPARARARDAHGQAHLVMVEPEAGHAPFAEGDEVLLVRRVGGVFHAVAAAPRIELL